MSTVVGRELAIIDKTKFERYKTWHSAEWLITLMYLGLTPLFLIASLFWNLPMTWEQVLGCLILFWALTIQNIGQSALLAVHQFIEASLIQIIGITVRHGISVLVLFWISPTLDLFVISQAVVSVLQMLVTRHKCNKKFRNSPKHISKNDILEQVILLFRKGKPLMVFGLSGAAVLQLDKVFVSSVMSPKDLTPYFLATTFCFLPISVLAGPVAQFFQPQVIRAISLKDSELTFRALKQFNCCLFVFAVLPAVSIWFLLEPIISIWLHQSEDVKLVTTYSSILLPGVMIGALGFLPYVILIGCQDYKFQAKFSFFITICTLSFVLMASFQKSVKSICFIYVLYHLVTVSGTWLRCLKIKAGGENIAKKSAMQMAVLSLFVLFTWLTIYCLTF